MKREREGGKGKLQAKYSFQNLFRKYFTIFVDDLPHSIDSWWLRRMFIDYGVVVDVYIPRKTRANSNSKFGFVRYRHRSEAELAIEKMNGSRRHNAILKVTMAQYGREKAASRIGDGYYYKGNTQGVHSEYGVHRMTYRQALTGEKMRCNIGTDFYSKSAMEAVEVIKARVVALELEVARLQNALVSATSIGKLKNDSGAPYSAVEEQPMEGVTGEDEGNASTIIEGQQTEEVTGGDGEVASNVGDDITGVRKAIVNVSFSGVANGSFSDEMWSAGSGEGGAEVSKSEIINLAVSRDDWDYEKGVQPPAIIKEDDLDFDDDSEDEEAREKTILVADDGSVCESIGVTPKRLDQGESCGSFSGERRPAGSGEGSVTGGFDIFNATGVWGSKFGNQEAATFDSVKGIIDDSEDEEALEELELYRQYFDFSEDRKQKDCAFSKRDKKPVSVETEGDRKSCFFANIKNRTKGQKKKEVESKKRRSYASSRWLGVKRRYVYVWL